MNNLLDKTINTLREEGNVHPTGIPLDFISSVIERDTTEIGMLRLWFAKKGYDFSFDKSELTTPSQLAKAIITSDSVPVQIYCLLKYVSVTSAVAKEGAEFILSQIVEDK